MHRALKIDEILSNILAHCNPPLFKNHRHGRPPGVAIDLVALATTCRMFKEPALDVLWAELFDLSPLAICLPTVSYLIAPGFRWYSFRRPLEQAEWDTLRSYTHRVRSVLDFGSAFCPECVRKFLSPPDPQPLFPNLRFLRCIFTDEITPLLCRPLPSLLSLDYTFVLEGNLPLFRESLQSFPGVSSNMKKLRIRVQQPEVVVDKLVSDYICRWSNPQTVYCRQIALDVNALTHLSRVPGLTQLTSTLSVGAIAPSNVLHFLSLRELKLFSESLVPISKLLAHAQLPAVMDFAVEISSYPSKLDVASFFTALQSSVTGDIITWLKLNQVHRSLAILRPDPLVLTADDLRPSTTLRNLHRLEVNLGWGVGLTDSQLLGLAPAWPHLEHLLINEEWGWQASSGITPDGLMRLLQTCRSLTRIALAVDTRGYTDIPPPRSPTNLGPDLPLSFSINVVDSVIDAASVPAIAAFFANIVSSPRFSLSAWSSWAFTWRTNKNVYADRWHEVYTRAGQAVAQRSVVSG